MNRNLEQAHNFNYFTRKKVRKNEDISIIIVNTKFIKIFYNNLVQFVIGRYVSNKDKMLYNDFNFCPKNVASSSIVLSAQNIFK